MQPDREQAFVERTPQEIYSSQNNQKLSYFYTSNRIISSPEVVFDFFLHFEQYSVEKIQKFLKDLILALRTVSTNAYILNRHERRAKKGYYRDLLEGGDDQKEIVSIVIDLIVKNVKNYIVFNLLQQVLEQLLPYSSLQQHLLKEAISKLIVNFYQKKVYASELFAASSIFKIFFQQKIKTEKDPNNILVFHGGNKIDILSNSKKELTWMLKDGFTLFFWIYLENVKSSDEASLPKLFTFYAPDVGGIQAYLVDNKVTYRVLGAKYTQPKIGSNGVFLGQLQPKKWNFVCFQHEGHLLFQKSKLKCYINKSKPNTVGLDPPKISSSNQTKYIFFDKIYCKTSSICLFPFLLGQQAIEEYNRNINSCQNIKNNKAYVFQARQGKIYERTGFGVSHNYIFQRNLSMNFQTILPLFHLLRYQEKDQVYPTINELLSSVVLFLRKSAQNQSQAVKNGYFKTISQLICEVKRNVFDQNTIKSILYIKHTITDVQLLDQYFSDFLWPLLQANIPLVRKQQILQIIKNAFAQNIAHYSNQIGLDQMINTLQNLEGSSLSCCQKHFKIASNKFQREMEATKSYGQQKKAQGYIFTLIENTFQNSKIHYAHEIYKLCRLLCLKFSPCFMLDLMNLLKKLLTQKFNERVSQAQIKEIVKYFQQKKVYQIFIHVIENNFFAQIKAQSVKLIYTLLIKKSSVEQGYISHLVSRSLWKINQFAEQRQESPQKKIEKIIIPISQEQSFEQEPSKQIYYQIQQPQQKQFTLVGPQAPALSNRLKGKKSFDFGFVNEVKKKPSRQIMEEEKTNQQEIDQGFSLQQIPKKPNKKKNLSLNINTEAINQCFTFGGQKGQQIIISESEEHQQIEKIIKLAKKCVAAMQGKRQQQMQIEKKQQTKKISYVPPPMTTKNKAVALKKTMNLNLISEQEDEPPIKIPTPLATKKSNKTPTSIKSSNQQNLFTLYNSLLQCCLGVSFQTSLISNSKIQVPSILTIFFKWIPQTDLETKFLNDLQIILQSNENMALAAQLPQLYDFLFELSYKCLLFEQMKEKRVYVQKLQKIIKYIFAFIFKEDLSGFSKFSFILNWIQSKKDEHYEPKCLFLTSRYVLLLILQCIEEVLVMNNSNDQIMQRNFQSLSVVIDSLKKIVPEGLDEIEIDNAQRVIFVEDFDLPASLIPYFKSQWVDFILYQRYLFIFKRFYCTQWYKNGLKSLSIQDVDFLSILRRSNLLTLQKQSAYYMRNNFLISLIEIQRTMFIEMVRNQSKQIQQYGLQSIWQTILLVIMAQFAKEKSLKTQRSQLILTFLKSCKLLAEKGVQRIVEIVPMLSMVKHYLSIVNQSTPNPQKVVVTQILDDVISNYIPEYLLNMGRTDLQSFIMHFNEVWIPNENNYRKVHSDLFLAYKEKIKKQEDINFIEFVSSLIEQQNERKQYTNIIVEVSNRVIRNNFRKLWSSLRIYGSVWMHPNFKWQQDRLYSKTIYSYQRYEPSSFFTYKVRKQFSKGKGRYFLKPKLIQPQFSKEKSQKQSTYSHEFNLEKALKILNDKLIIGASKKSWLLSKGQQSISFLMDFKNVRIVNTLTYRTGFISIISDNLVFISSLQIEKPSHLTIDQYRLRQDKTIHKSWPLQYIREIYKRRYVNKKKCVQINFIQNKSVLIDFDTQQDSDEFCKRLLKVRSKCINLIMNGKSFDPKKLIQSQQFIKKWMNYQMSNFDYLMELNTLGGRAYSDLTQYPVFPWIYRSYNQQKLSLNDEKHYRNLGMPMGGNGTEERIKNFEQRYDVMHMQDQYAKNFHYGTHYSSPGIIYHFLVRLSPYTQGSVLLQSGRFDFADRLFFSIADSFKNSTMQYSDVRELIPQMYSIPQTYINVNGLDLGIMQNKKRVNIVQLPQWCNDNPYQFVVMMKKGLQEKLTSCQIHKWIDLIFGYKQKGDQAIKALNCFYYLTYEDSVPWEHIKNQKDIQSIESQIVNFGQTPSQVFVRPHPQRNSIGVLRNFRAICDSDAEPKVYRPSRSTVQKGGEIQFNPLRQIDQSIILMKWISESKLVFIRKSGEIIFYKCFPNTNPATKVPFQCTIQKQKRVERIKKHIFDPNEYYDPSLQVYNFPIELIGNGHTVCLGGLSDGKLAFIDVDTNNLITTYHSHSHTISCIKSDSRQNFLITGDIKGNVVIWQIKLSGNNVSKLIEKKVLKDQKDQISSIYFSNDLQCVAIASLDGSVFLYNIITGKKLRVYYHEKRMPIDEVIITSNPLAAVVFFCNTENTIYSYSINGQLIARSHEKNFEHFFCPTVMKDSKLFEYLAFGNEKSEIIFKQLPFLTIPAKNNFKVAKDACVNKISVSKFSRFLFTGCSDGQLTVITDPILISP